MNFTLYERIPKCNLGRKSSPLNTVPPKGHLVTDINSTHFASLRPGQDGPEAALVLEGTWGILEMTTWMVPWDGFGSMDQRVRIRGSVAAPQKNSRMPSKKTGTIWKKKEGFSFELTFFHRFQGTLFSSFSGE